jgi:hypothetical protein
VVSAIGIFIHGEIRTPNDLVTASSKENCFF